MKSAMIVIGIVLLILLLILAGGIGMMGIRWLGMGSGMMGGYGFSPVGGILMAVFWGIVLCAIAVVGSWLAHSNDHFRFQAGSGESPLHILKSRYARGEITKEQFETIKRDLGES